MDIMEYISFCCEDADPIRQNAITYEWEDPIVNRIYFAKDQSKGFSIEKYTEKGFEKWFLDTCTSPVIDTPSLKIYSKLLVNEEFNKVVESYIGDTFNNYVSNFETFQKVQTQFYRLFDLLEIKNLPNPYVSVIIERNRKKSFDPSKINPVKSVKPVDWNDFCQNVDTSKWNGDRYRKDEYIKNEFSVPGKTVQKALKDLDNYLKGSKITDKDFFEIIL